MNYNELLEQLRSLEIKEMREDQPEHMEFVITASRLDSLSSILKGFYGPASASPEEQPSNEAKKHAGPYGGIRKGQTLYYLNSGEVSHCALLWPWGDGQSITIKLYQDKN